MTDLYDELFDGPSRWDAEDVEPVPSDELTEEDAVWEYPLDDFEDEL